VPPARTTIIRARIVGVPRVQEVGTSNIVKFRVRTERNKYLDRTKHIYVFPKQRYDYHNCQIRAGKDPRRLMDLLGTEGMCVGVVGEQRKDEAADKQTGAKIVYDTIYVDSDGLCLHGPDTYRSNGNRNGNDNQGSPGSAEAAPVKETDEGSQGIPGDDDVPF